MKKILFCLILFVGFAGFAQQTGINGMVMDGEDVNQPLAFADIKIKGTSLATTTDIQGKFSMELLPGTYTFVIDFIGYESLEIKDLVLTDKNLDLSPVVLKARRMASPLLASSEE